ncbi:MAG: hypothetical protein WC523_04920 [Patescibacteria group bacterium]
MGGFKLTTKEIEDIIKQKDGYYIGEETKRHIRYIKVRCRFDHEWWVSLSGLKSGDWCKKCRDKNTNIDREKIISLLNEKGYELITVGELNRLSKIQVKCLKHNYSWTTCYGNIKYVNKKYCCPLCTHNYPNIEVMRNFIQNKNGTLIDIIKSTDSSERNILVKCNVHNRVFKTRWNTLQKGQWCLDCDDENRKIKYEDIKQIVEEKNGCLVSTECSTAKELFVVRCNKDNFEWKTSWARIQSGCWCPRCSGYEKYTLERVSEIIANKGGILLNHSIKNVKSKISTKCSCGNIFDSSLNHIVNHGVWCQICSHKHSVQKDLFNILQKIFPSQPIEYNYRGFKWLIASKQLEIDLWLPELKLAIEYDGEQHFKPVRFSNKMSKEKSEKVFRDIKFRDLQKTALIANHPEDIKHFIRFSYSEDITEESVIKKLKDCGVLNDICNNRGNIP